MKKLILLAAVAALAGCTKPETKEEPIVPQNSTYNGTVTVIYENEPFDNNDIKVEFTPAEDGKTASITIYKIRFVPKMPVTVDVTIPGIAVESDTETIKLSCDNVIPYAMGGEFPKYLVTGFEGEIKGSELSFSLNFGDYPTSFSGSVQ